MKKTRWKWARQQQTSGSFANSCDYAYQEGDTPQVPAVMNVNNSNDQHVGKSPVVW